MKKVECDWCEGSGDVGMFSCCGDDMSMNDIGICPSCGEHWAYEKSDCDNCGGKGSIMEPETPEEVAAEAARHENMLDEFRKRREKWNKTPEK